MVLTVAYRHPPPAIGEVAQVQSECLAGAQTAIKHQAHQGQVASATQRAQQGRDLVRVERPQQAPDRLDLQDTPGRLLAGDAGQKGTVPVDDADHRAVHHPYDRVRSVEPAGQDRPIIERRHCRKRPVDRGRAQARRRGRGTLAGGEHRRAGLPAVPRWRGAEVGQQAERALGRQRVPPQSRSAEEAPQVAQSCP